MLYTTRKDESSGNITQLFDMRGLTVFVLPVWHVAFTSFPLADIPLEGNVVGIWTGLYAEATGLLNRDKLCTCSLTSLHVLMLRF